MLITFYIMARKPFMSYSENKKRESIVVTRYIAHPKWNDGLEFEQPDKPQFYGCYFHQILDVTGCYERFDKHTKKAACDLCLFRLRKEHEIENTTVKIKRCKFKGKKCMYFEFTENMGESKPYNPTNVK